MTDHISRYRDIAEQNRMFADLALCDEARDDHLNTAAFFDRLADSLVDRIDYAAITREVSYLS